MFRVALCSFLFQANRGKNLHSISNAIINTAKRHCNLICFPECVLSGLSTDVFSKDTKLAVKIPGKITQKIGNLALKYKIHVAIGLLERTNKRIYDSAVLFNNQGKIATKYRRINPQWHTKSAPKSIYMEGKSVQVAKTLFGKFAFALCGDIFDDRVTYLIKKANPDYLIVPMSRSFDDCSYNQKRWDREELSAYAAQIRKICTLSFLVNALESQDDGAAFGGCFVISPKGRVLAKTRIGKPSVLVWQR